MVVGSAADEAETVADHAFGQGLGVDDDLLLVRRKAGLQGLVETDGLGGDDVHQRPP